VVAQYYTFFRLGRRGFTAVQQACREAATYVSAQVEQLPQLRLVSRGNELPVFAFTTSGDLGWDVFALSRALRERGWLVPAYTFPAHRQDLSVLRVVCRNGFSLDLAELFVRDLGSAVEQLAGTSGRAAGTASSAFHH
jgi:glutamate decarboxylase